MGGTGVDRRTDRACRNRTNWNVHAQTTVIMQGYPRIPLALCGHQQPSGRRPGPRDLDDGRVSRLAALAGRRVLFQPGTGAGFWLEQHARARRLSEWRSAEGRRPFPKIPPATLCTSARPSVSAASRKTLRTARFSSPGKRDIDRVTVTVGRFAVGDYLRRQLLRQGSARRFHELGDVVVGGLRLPGRSAGLHPRRRGRAQPQGLGAARRPVPGAHRAQQRRSRVQDRRRGASNSRNATRSSISPASCGSACFANRGNTGNYRNALAITAADPTLDINDVMSSIRRDNPKYGFYVNAEQQIMKDVGLFARASWNDGQNEILSFTDIDRSVSGGLSIKGSYWGRPSDTIGIGGADQRAVRRAPRLPRRRRPRPADRRRPAQLRPRTDSRDLLRLRDRQEFHVHRRLSADHKSRL